MCLVFLCLGLDHIRGKLLFPSFSLVTLDLERCPGIGGGLVHLKAGRRSSYASPGIYSRYCYSYYIVGLVGKLDTSCWNLYLKCELKCVEDRMNYKGFHKKTDLVMAMKLHQFQQREPIQLKCEAKLKGGFNVPLEAKLLFLGLCSAKDVMVHTIVTVSILHTRWFLGYTCCDACGRLFVKGNYCPVCLKVMFASGKYNLVHDFFRKVKKSSIPNALVYKVLVNTLWKEGKTYEVVLIVQDMERRGIVGCAALYYDLARCLCDAGRFQEALLQIEKICKVASSGNSHRHTSSLPGLWKY